MRLRKFAHFQQQNVTNEIAPMQDSNSTNTTSATQQNNDQGSGINTGYLILGILAIIAVCIVFIYIIILLLRKRTKQKFEQTPQYFSRRPDLSCLQKCRYNVGQIVPLSGQRNQIKKMKTFEGQYYQIVFNQENNNSCFYYDRVLKHDCYFQIEIQRLESALQIGFIPVKQINSLIQKQQRKKNEEDEAVQPAKMNTVTLDINGVSLDSGGTITVDGQVKFSCNWSLKYGDVIGIGITQHKTGIRVWVTKNGALVNPASQDDMIKNLDLGKMKMGNIQTQLKQAEEQDNQFHREQIQTMRRKIQLKKQGKFAYHAVIVSSPVKQDANTIINWNVGAHNFRLYDGVHIGGLLH